MATEVEAFKSWALIELMGHRKRAGLCEDVTMIGSRLLRVDVPSEEPGKFTTEFYGAAAIYGLHPCDEATARRLAKSHVYDRAIEPYQEPFNPQLSFIDPMDKDEENIDNERG